jgi:hypothetical protein
VTVTVAVIVTVIVNRQPSLANTEDSYCLTIALTSAPTNWVHGATLVTSSSGVVDENETFFWTSLQ